MAALDDGSPITVKDLSAICTIFGAHVKWIQSELSTAVGEGFGISKDMTNLFKCLKSNSAFFTPDETSAFETAARITGAVALNQQAELLQKLVGSHSGGRGGGRAGRGRWRGGRRGSDRGRDFYDDAVSTASKEKI